ncbi:MarR family winged helix-turn-helix transcriptional regulator [Tranquillimonas alkanivorans]|uniref:Transcriptional regulator, MarR family n=1 Tax=Tranquillimonas alkanivorans TaxID=441119 RepID=A0A1I5VGD8_9RHOB|nr:MarR family transcriptional regulator [Tranquillimonas alkanivorans]SFQ06529.1 transcriptional regulator, MarR family [Tranquillimonas alkanivorans]
MSLDIHTMAGHLIRRLHQRSNSVFVERVKAAGHDLTPVQFAAMDTLDARPGIDQARVAALIGYDRATIGGVIERLEKRGLVRREVNRQDRRARLVRLTREGERVVAALRPVVRDLQDDILANLDPEERAAVNALMAKSLAFEAPDPEER